MKRILPPTLFLLFVFAMGLISWTLPHLLHMPFHLLGLPLCLLGLALAVHSKRLFKRLNTNIMTFDAPDVLVTQGIFRYSRNPMYLGLVIALFGVTLLTGGSPFSLVLLALFFAIVDRWYIAFEEQAMHQAFGQQYETYCNNVRRWI